MGDSLKPIPVVICGRVEAVGKSVIDGLKPEYEAILFCLGSEATAAELPYILRGTAPPTQSSRLGSGSYATPPVAVIMGAAWDADDVALVKAAIQSVAGVSPRPVILRNDTSIPAPKPPAPGYATQLIRRMRDCLGKLGRGEPLAGPDDGVVWY